MSEKDIVKLQRVCYNLCAKIHFFFTRMREKEIVKVQRVCYNLYARFISSLLFCRC